MKVEFDGEKYLEEQSQPFFNGKCYDKLYLEFGQINR